MHCQSASTSPFTPTSSAVQLTESTNYILGVTPVKWISLFSAASARAASPATALLTGLAAAAIVRALR
jgi:hypothetical protein